MIAIPALQLRDSECVQPAFGAVGPFDPVGVVRSWAHTGFHHILIVDADAESNVGTNAALIEDIIRDAGLAVQVGGGIRSAEQVQRFFDAGAASVIVGDRAFEEPEWLANLADLFPGTIVVATDVRERRIATRGWVRTLPLDIFDVVEELNGLRLGGLLVTQLADGRLSSPDLTLLEDVAGASGFPLFAACRVATMNDLRALEHRGVAGVVIDGALHEGDLDPRTVAAEFGE